ncbi:tape measure protein [Pseudomonas aeruginosa]|uniref:tape measure protein n=1 Tax=Pseudomonas aeruginosa TaxID=287 RepID=UPI000F51C2A4|nr:tape measure protein [Pseudomonas aeruginosa]RQA19948.1 hypothetical protein IPC507_26580 [Pseudomonas aeruginosa]
MSDYEVQGMLIQLEATTAQLRRELAGADSVVARTTQSIDRNLAQVDSAFDRTAQGAQQAGTLIRGAFAAIAGAGLVGSIIHQVDAYGQIADRLKMATGSTEEYNEVQQHLLRTAQETYRPLAEAQELYIRTADVMRSLGFNTQQTLDITDSFSFLLVTNAASADKASSALGAYSKALQTGKVEADGWVSIQDAMPTIVDAIASATGKSAEEIRKLGVQGKLSLDDINTGLLRTVEVNRKAAADMSVSVQDALVNIQNALGDFFGRMEESTGVVAGLASVISVVGDNISSVAAVMAGAGVAALTVYTARGALAIKTALADRAARIAQAEAVMQAAIADQRKAETLTVLAAREAAAARGTAVQTEMSLALAQARQREAAATASVATAQAGLRAASAGLLTVLGGPMGLALLAGTAAANWIRLPRAGTTSVDVTGIYAGGYLARVRAVSAFDITSVWKSSILTQLSGKTGAPPALAFLRTTSGPWKIGLEWGFPASGAADTAYTEIQQSVTPGGSEQNATALGLFAYPTDTHTLTSLAAGARLAFRGRLIDRTGNVGPWSAWVDGISSTDASEYNELITKEYVESALGEQFFAEIDQMQVDISGLQDQIDNLTDVLAYDPTKTYAKNDIVRVGNRLYQAKQTVPLNASPPNATYWADIGQSIETANGLAQQVATNTADITELDGKVEAAASSLDVLQAAARREPATGEKADALKGWDTIARAATEVTVRANEDEAQAKRTSLLEARTVTAEGRIATVESVVASNNAVTVQRLDQLSGQVASNASAISTEQTVRANADSALGQRVDTVSARTDTNEANIQTTSQAVTSLDGNVKALYSVKLQAHANGQKYAAGWQLGFDSGTSVTTMAFQADRFLWFNSSSGQTVAPVSIVGGQMFINNAMIQDGSITNAKIGNVIQSTALGANGEPLWKLDKGGAFTMNSATSGGFMRQTAEAIKVYDGNLVLRVQIGNLDV